MIDLGHPQWGLFLGAAFVLAVTPGQGIAYVLARTVAGGRAEGLASALGTAVGGFVHVVAAAAGLSALLAQSAEAFLVVKYVGAAYLAYLGLRILLSSQREPQAVPALRASGARRAFYEGIVVETLNVKMAVFFLAFIPHFLDPSASAFAQFVVLGAICVLFNMIVDVVVIHGASRFRASRAARRLLDAASGGTLVGLGAYVALAKLER